LIESHRTKKEPGKTLMILEAGTVRAVTLKNRIREVFQGSNRAISNSVGKWKGGSILGPL